MALVFNFQDVIRCNVCNDEVGHLHCDTCQVYICKSCTGTHVMSDLSKQHVVVECKKRSKIKLNECKKHTSQRCELYCKQCNVPVCSKCMASTHANHSVIDIQDFCKTKQEEIRKENEKIKTSKISELEKAISELKKQMENIPSELDEIKNQINEHGRVWHNQIEAIIKQFTDEVEEMKKTYLDRLRDHQQKLEDQILLCRQILEDNSYTLHSNEMSTFDVYKSRIHEIKDISLCANVELPKFQCAKLEVHKIKMQFGSLYAGSLEIMSALDKQSRKGDPSSLQGLLGRSGHRQGLSGFESNKSEKTLLLLSPFAQYTPLDTPYPQLQGAKSSKEITVRQANQTKLLYHAYLCREVAVFQEAGIICYNSASSSMPVAQFMGPKPFSNTLKRFSLTIVAEGDKKTIAIGIAGRPFEANRQPGWNRWSMGYHADDGGIYIEAGHASTRREECSKGDVMAVVLDVRKGILTFLKNDVEMCQTTVNFPRGGYHPIIGLHSPGECVKLNELQPWLPESSEKDELHKPKSLEAAKYGNLWICPAHVVMMTKYGRRGFRGFTLLHNPTMFKIGYKMDPPLVEKKHLGENEKLVGILDSKETKAISVYSKDNAGIQNFEIHWLSLEKTREYTLNDIEVIDVQNFSTHMMKCEISVGENDV